MSFFDGLIPFFIPKSHFFRPKKPLKKVAIGFWHIACSSFIFKGIQIVQNQKGVFLRAPIRRILR
jgi:hypothetical protein